LRFVARVAWREPEQVVLKFGVISDIHGNARGLERAFSLMGDVDEVLCLGDCVSHTRFSNTVVAMLKERGARVVLGNHDVDYLGRLAGAPSQRGVADDGLVDWLRRQPERLELDVAGKRLIMVHATPWTRDYVYPGSLAMRRFAEVEADFVLGGHTHTPFAGRIGRALVVNPGSAGHARDQPDGPMLSCAVLDTQTEEVRLIPYPDEPYVSPAGEGA
jgi:putative phosphoesterase